MRLLIMGPQGVGKGTQAALLAEHYGIPAISTGDIFRYNIKNKTEQRRQSAHKNSGCNCDNDCSPILPYFFNCLTKSSLFFHLSYNCVITKIS